jgi:hypothetical protein
MMTFQQADLHAGWHVNRTDNNLSIHPSGLHVSNQDRLLSIEPACQQDLMLANQQASRHEVLQTSTPSVCHAFNLSC